MALGMFLRQNLGQQMSRRMAVVAAAVLLLAGCAAPVSGTVTGKDYDPPRTERYLRTDRQPCGTDTYWTTQWSGTGSTRVSRQVRHTRTKYCTTQVPDTRHVPADWDLTVRDDEGKTHEVDVNQMTFNRYQVNDRYEPEK
ncbi:hypothetical protein ACSYDW_01245 [Paeniglutamicibacter sp. R2-26]|uniref:hypothetical protein n=1 Tax=Paeniglutamicibacter sp. R2-26 TaxID=3144417 RepID=UPI003EE6484E